MNSPHNETNYLTMRDEEKSKAQLISELRELRQQLEAQQVSARSKKTATILERDELISTLRQSRKDLSESREETEASQKLLTESREALRISNQNLADAHERYNILGDLVPFGVWTADAQGHITFLSEAFLEMSGIPSQEIERLEWVDQLARPTVLKAISDWSCTLDQRDIWENEFTITSQKGQHYDILIRGVPMLDKDGRIVSWLGINLDISKRKQAESQCEQLIKDVLDRESQIRESEEKFSKAFYNSPSYMAITTFEDGTYIDVNQAYCDLTGYSREELIGRTATELGIVTPEERTENIRQLKKAGDRLKFMEQVWHTRTDESKNVIFSQEMIELHGQQYLIANGMDITDWKRAEDEREKLQARLNQSQKMESVGRLAGGVAHDFNNILIVILGNTEMALEMVDQQHPLYAKLHQIQNAALRSSNIVRQLLTFASRQTIAPKTVDLNEALEQILKMLRRLIGEDIDLSWQPGNNLWPVKVDPAQVDQIMANLAINARDAIDGVGKLIIETGRATFDGGYCAKHPECEPGDFVFLKVSDDGCGMDKATQEKLFEPFFTTKEVGKGTGLGMATVYGIVKQNNGFIAVSSEPGHGTAFTIYLPRHRAVDVPVRPENTGSSTLTVEF